MDDEFDLDALLEQEQQIAMEALEMDVPEDMLPPEFQVSEIVGARTQSAFPPSNSTLIRTVPSPVSCHRSFPRPPP